MQSVDSPTERTLILLTVSLCTMLYSLTVTIANVTLPQLQGALAATPDQVSWIITLNIVATAIVTPAGGWLVARLGSGGCYCGQLAALRSLHSLVRLRTHSGRYSHTALLKVRLARHWSHYRKRL